jgi:DNA-binding CsgD family transcriptional regulator
MDTTSNYKKAYLDLLSSELVAAETVMKHVDKYAMLDSLTQIQASFFYIIELATGKYHFVGKQQELLSGVPNDEFIAGGVESFLRRVHPADLPVIVHEVYGDFVSWFRQRDASISKEQLVFQYNYRFLNRHDRYSNVMEHVYVQEVDSNGDIALLLGNVIHLGDGDILPIKSAMNLHRNDIVETVAMKTYNTISGSFKLTRREMDILKNLASGKTSKEIGAQLFISQHTVNTHRRNLLNKMNCSSVVEMVQLAFRAGFI